MGTGAQGVPDPKKTEKAGLSFREGADHPDTVPLLLSPVLFSAGKVAGYPCA